MRTSYKVLVAGVVPVVVVAGALEEVEGAKMREKVPVEPPVGIGEVMTRPATQPTAQDPPMMVIDGIRG